MPGVGGTGAAGGAVVAGGRRRAGGGASVERAQPPADARLEAAAAPTRAVSPAPLVVFALGVAAVAAGLIYRRLARRHGCEQHSAKERETPNAGAVASDVPTTPTTEAVAVDGVSLRVLE